MNWKGIRIGSEKGRDGEEQKEWNEGKSKTERKRNGDERELH